MEQLFRKDSVTPNMHLHCHLADCMTDYGPLHSFWCYAFERCNGILGSLPNNNRSIENQLMNRFLSENHGLSYLPPSEFSENFLPVAISQNATWYRFNFRYTITFNI